MVLSSRHTKRPKRAICGERSTLVFKWRQVFCICGWWRGDWSWRDGGRNSFVLGLAPGATRAVVRERCYESGGVVVRERWYEWWYEEGRSGSVVVRAGTEMRRLTLGAREVLVSDVAVRDSVVLLPALKWSCQRNVQCRTVITVAGNGR